MHRFALKVAQRILAALPANRSWLRSLGCAMILQDQAGNVLLVRHSYVDPDAWMLPAGRLSGGEWPLKSAHRELEEELGISAAALSILEWEDSRYWGHRYQTYIVVGTVDSAVRPDDREIEEARFFPLSGLPINVSEPTLRRLERWRYRCSFPFPIPPFVRPQYLEEKGLGRAMGELDPSPDRAASLT